MVTFWIKGSEAESCYKAWKAGIPATYVEVQNEDRGTKVLEVAGDWAEANEALIESVCDCDTCRRKRGEDLL